MKYYAKYSLEEIYTMTPYEFEIYDSLFKEILDEEIKKRKNQYK